MEVSGKHVLDKKAFVPIEITVKFDTQEEVNLFRDLMSRNVTVPSHLLEQGLIVNAQIRPLTDMMGVINSATLIRS